MITLRLGSLCVLQNGNLDPGQKPGLQFRIWQSRPVCTSVPDSPARRALGRLTGKGFLWAAFLLAVLEAESSFTSPPFRAPNKAPSEPGLGCTNTHIWAAVRSKAAELPHSWPSAPDLQDKGRLWPCGGPQELGALEGTAGNSFLLLPPGTLPLTALPAEGMPFPPGGLAPIRTGEDRTKTAGR